MPLPETDSPPDWDLAIRQVSRGHEAAARRMVEDLYPQLLRIVRSHLPRAADEEDLMQEIFMKIFSKLDGYRREQPFPHWAARIALNTCYDQLRRQRVRPEFRFADLGEEESRFIEETLSSSASQSGSEGPDRDGSEVVERLLASLNPVERMVLRMLDMERKSVREIMDLTGWSPSKIKVAAMRGRRKLADTLKRLERRAVT
ncbi:MAG: RNA polymerase sigma factor [Verrucomicrobiaceae bacterium]|nr:MAG: RNA polymerase sigma factor [Verrucomicrobiaceae bacterium]